MVPFQCGYKVEVEIYQVVMQLGEIITFISLTVKDGQNSALKSVNARIPAL